MADHKVKCAKCKYRGVLGGALVCDYILIVGHSRPCKASECTVYEKGNKVNGKHGETEEYYE